MSHKTTTRNAVLASALALAWCAGAAAADPATIDWGKVPTRTITLFYPGQSSHEWLVDRHVGKDAVKGGEACLTCHAGSEKVLGDKLVKGGALEPTPVPGKPGSVDLKVQVAYDANNAYFRFQWKTLNPFPGNEYPLLRYDGKEWKPYGQPRLNKAVREGAQPGIYEDRLSMMVDDGKVAGFAKQGCWLTCHAGERDMPGQASADDARAAIKKNDVRKYLPDSRANASDWRTIKSGDEIAKLKQAGVFLDLIQWRAHRSNPVGMGDDGYVLEYRNFDEGKNPFASNVDPQTKAPKYMWDKAKMGYSTITADELRKADHILLRDQNVVAFEANGGFKAGDLLPSYYVSRAEAKGSAADNQAVGTWKDGGWTVVLSRPLGLANADDKALREGGVYTIGFAVHDDNVTTRGHYVSFPVRVGFGAEADVKAVKLP
jgi:hypothetical protein